MPQANDDWDSEDVHTEDRCGEDVSPSPNQAGSSQDYVVVETNRPATPTRPHYFVMSLHCQLTWPSL